MSMTKRIQIPVSDQEYSHFQAAAHRAGLPLAEWALQQLREKADEGRAELGQRESLELLKRLEAPIAPVQRMIEESVRGRYGPAMSQILLDIPEDSLLALRVSAEEMGEELRLAAAVKLFEIGRLSSGAAAELAGIPKPLFLVRLADYDVPAFRQTEDELRRDLGST